MANEGFNLKAPDLSSEACAWVAQLETGELSKEDLDAFREWINRSPRHYAEIKRLARLSHDINVIADMAGPLKAAAARREAVLRLRSASLFVNGWGVAAALVLALAGLAAVILRQPGDTPAPVPYVIATEIGEFREIALADGSTVKLNTDSEIEVELDQSQRRIRLLKGEAYFEVARNPDNPFVVFAADRQVTAVGTAFAVRWTDNAFTVTVSEGKVSVNERLAKTEQGAVQTSGDAEAGDIPPLPEVAPHLLEAGQRLAVSDFEIHPTIETLSPRDLTRDFSWRTGFLEFDKAPLGEVVREMERYTTLDIEIADDELKNLKFGGVIRIGETDAFFEALELSFGVKAVRFGDDRVLLERVG